MPGVLVDDTTAPFDSSLLSPIFDNGGLPRSVSQGDELQRVCSPRKSFFSDSNGDEFAPGSSSIVEQSPLNLSALYGMDIFSSPPSSPSEKSSTPRSRNVDLREEYAQRVFTRALSKLGSSNSVAIPDEEDLIFGDVQSILEGGPFSESAGCRAAHASLSLSASDLKDLVNGGGTPIPMAPAYEHCSSSSTSSGGGGGGGMAGLVGGSPVFPDALSALHKFLPSNNEDSDSWPAVDVYSCDEFRMYEFKVRRCMRGRSHDWTECPFAHPGEKARRRDPRRFHYAGTACPEFRKGSCRRGDSCEFAHGVFECWLHPARYRTQPCKDGTNCRRRVCFFAHTPQQLRLLPGSLQAGSSPSSRVTAHSSALKAASLGGSYDGSPLRQALANSLDSAVALESLACLGQNGIFDGTCDSGLVGSSSPRCGHLGFASKASFGCSTSQISSPTSTLAGHSFSPPPLSPPLSPSGSPPMSPNSPNSWAASALVRNLSYLSATQGSHQCLSALSQVQASIAASCQNSGSISASSMPTHGLSPLSITVSPAQRRHLDRLHSIPSLSISPSLEARDVCPLNSPSSLSSERVPSQAMNDLMITLQQLELNACPTGATRPSDFWSSNGPSFRYSQSVPATPTKASWGSQIDHLDFADAPETLERVESGRDLRAKIYGRLCKENPLENDSPDLGWVNELVK